MRRILSLAVAVSSVIAWADEFSGAGCYARWEGSVLSVGNERFARTYRATDKGLKTVSFLARGGRDLVRKCPGSDAALTVTALVDGTSPVRAESLVLTVRAGGEESVLRLFAGASGPLVTRPRRIDGLSHGDEPADYKALYKWRQAKAARLTERVDRLFLGATHPQVTAFELFDQTDVTDELVVTRNWQLSNCEHPWFLSCAAIDVRDLETDEGFVLLRLAPMPGSRPAPGEDFVLQGGFGRSVAAVDNGYPVAELAYRGGDVGRTRALHGFQRCLRRYRPGRDGVFLSNTWGDGNRDSRINEEFLMREIAAGAELGVDVIQIDDGWQKGRSSNSASVRKGGGTWGRYWDVDPDFWKPCPVRFPNGLGPVVDAARKKRLRFGLWFGPDSSNDFRHWEDDAACLFGYFRDYGIEYFKIDSVTIRSGTALERQERMFARMLEESKGAMSFDLDCTASTRPGYLGLVEIGPLFVENRYIRKGDSRLWRPEHTLRNLWELSRIVDPVRLRMEVLNPLRLPELYGDDILAPSRWPQDVPFAIAMCASPLGWFEISNLAPETVAAMKPLVAAWKRERANLHGGITHPVGACPDGFSWTGFLTEAADGCGGYALLFREMAKDPSCSIDFTRFFSATCCEVIGGRGTAFVKDGTLTVTVPRERDYIWVRLLAAGTSDASRQDKNPCRVGSRTDDVPPSLPVAWSRDAGKLHVEQGPDGSQVVKHTGTHDWALRYSRPIRVTAGESFEIVSDVSWTGDSPVATSVEMKDAKGKVINYLHAYKVLPKDGVFHNKFVVPAEGATMTVRLNGCKPTEAIVRKVELVSVGHHDYKPMGDRTLENDRVRVVVRGGDGSPEVTDKRTGRTWRPCCPSGVTAAIMVSEERPQNPQGLALRVFDTQSGLTFRAEYVLEETGELAVTLDGKDELPDYDHPYPFPMPFATRKGDRLIVPMNEGMGFPVDEHHEGLGRLRGWSGHGLCMSFFGVSEDASGAGWMAILETPDDGLAQAVWDKEKELWTIGPRWVGSWGEFCYPRKFRYVFFDRGGHTAMCKRYRAYAKATGKFKGFSDKVRERPNVDRLFGAANVWCWSNNPTGIVASLVSAGIDRLIWSRGGDPEVVTELSKMPNVLVSRYDNYQDVPTPELVKERLRPNLGPLAPAWPKDIAWETPTGGLAKAWAFKSHDGLRWVHFARMCDSRAPENARRCLREELKLKPYNCRFIDTTVAAPWYECRNPAHPMRRSDSRRHKMELLRLMGDEFGLVTGSETGHDAAVPYCDYFEGMMSIAPYRVPESGRRMQDVWTNAPARTVKYMVGEKYRLPLWELVYHDCVCAHWFWGDHVGKTPEIWRKRDLFNVLYGTMGLYMFNNAMWKADKDKYVRSFKTTTGVARATACSEMLDHVFLTPDRAVQRTIFANGVKVTVNFGDRPFKLENGEILPAMDYQTEGLP